MNYKETFQKNGYIIVKDYLKPNELEKMYLELHETIDYAFPVFKNSSLSFDEKYLMLQKENDTLRIHFYNLIGKNLYLNNLWNKEMLNNILKNISNEPFFIDKVQIRFDTPGNDRLLPMHQERGQISSNEITGWLPFVDINNESGGVEVIEQSHKLGDLPIILHDNYLDSGHDYSGVELKYLKNPKKVFMNKGDLLLFHTDLIHGSYSNLTNNIRLVSVARFNPLNDIPYLKNTESELNIPKKFN